MATKPTKATGTKPATGAKPAGAPATPAAASADATGQPASAETEPDASQAAQSPVLDGESQPGDGEPGETETFLNRAQRRAKGRNPSQAMHGGRGKVGGGHGPASTQRNWANRRSG